MSDVTYSVEQQCRSAHRALIDNVVSRTGTDPELVHALLADSGVTPSSAELLDAARFNAICLGAVVTAEIDGLPCNRSAAFRDIVDAAYIGYAQGLRTGANVSPYEQMVARIVIATGENAFAVKHAMNGIGLAFGWQATLEGQARAEMLTLARFQRSGETFH
jgi:hypothetical protein